MFAVFKSALRALRRNVLRSFLTMLGIIVGIAAVIVGVSMGTGAKAEVDKRIASMGQNLLTVLSGNMSRGGVRGGENFSETDVRNASKVCLIGSTTASTLFGENVDPVGQVIRIKNAPFTIVGWLEAKGSGSFGQDQDDVILVPYTSVMQRLSGDTKFRSFFVQAESPDAIEDVQRQLGELLRQRHQIGEGKDDD